MDCKVAENCLREKGRMCRSHSANCAACALSRFSTGKSKSCSDFQTEYPAEAVAIVQKWSDEHPRRTYLSDFLEKYPNAPRRESGIPNPCPYSLGYTSSTGCSCNCVDCWNTPVEDKP